MNKIINSKSSEEQKLLLHARVMFCKDCKCIKFQTGQSDIEQLKCPRCSSLNIVKKEWIRLTFNQLKRLVFLYENKVAVQPAKIQLDLAKKIEVKQYTLNVLLLVSFLYFITISSKVDLCNVFKIPKTSILYQALSLFFMIPVLGLVGLTFKSLASGKLLEKRIWLDGIVLNEKHWLTKHFKRNITLYIFAFIGSIVLSLQTVAYFAVLSNTESDIFINYWFIMWLVNIPVFVFLHDKLTFSLGNILKEYISKAITKKTPITINILLLSIASIMIGFIQSPINYHPIKIPKIAEEIIVYSNLLWENYIQTIFWYDATINTLRMIPQQPLGSILFTILFLTSISIFQFVSMTYAYNTLLGGSIRTKLYLTASFALTATMLYFMEYHVH